MWKVNLLKKLRLRLKGVPAGALREPKSLDHIFALADDEKFYWDLVERGLFFFNMDGDAENTEGERVLLDIYAFRFEASGGGTLRSATLPDRKRKIHTKPYRFKTDTRFAPKTRLPARCRAPPT